MSANSKNNERPLLPLSSPAFVKGVLIGAGIAYLATNKTVQQAVISGAVRTFSFFQSSFEEMKEKIQDVKAEMSNED